MKMGYTRFGKIIRKLMIDRDENLGTLANMFDVSTAFVSSVLVGNKPVPEEWFEKVSDHYELTDDERNGLYDAYCETKKTIKLDISSIDTGKKKLALQFQRKLPGLSDEELKSIFKILEDGNE